MVLVKELKIFHLFIVGKNDKNKVFCDILVITNAFLDYKNKSSKRRKIGICAKGLVIVFVIKLKIFYPLLLSKIGKKKRVSRYLR